ncbi:PMT family glycosyltransferase, 4-amino-4-deoxy-L-arabinose transferase [Thioflavicoccus mobilis 8321]|uniref:PMT family glycosyltransferase, 4-amino-4-deoxy-L-arabinose transferase n=1 Tax=Thioflavicoccus mobilis 8321 TaxID=765912 RepID=L0GSQ4_9GAMM|nr:glycosyltransferase family 39 protein [Thioflavicoccus mobilis]AGA89001.1 PMT family glycosyltransferase, 4-amino-4-deoxy-L-arabinose transferase [Thioflavicoccus mobilis 8321]
MSKIADYTDQALHSRWLIVAVVVLAFFWQIGAAPLYDLDEGAFTEATREMLASGNFVTPYQDGEPRYDKPVLIYWLQAASAKVLGFSEMALRLPSALAASLWVLALWWFVREKTDEETATVAAIAMALSLEVSLIAKAAVADAVLNLFIALAFFEIYRFWHAPARGPLLRAYLWMGLGFLTKGPVAVFFPVVASFLFFWSEGTLKNWLRAAFSPLGWLVFLLVAGPWYLAIYLDNGPGFFESFFLEHNLGRFGDAMQGHGGFFGYYVIVLPLILLPFTGWFIQVLRGVRESWRLPLERFLWIWFITVFVVFSFSGTKLPHYLLYGITPLFILMARHRMELVNRWLAYTPPVAFFAVLFFLPQILATINGFVDEPHVSVMLANGIGALDIGYNWYLVCGLAAVAAVIRWRKIWPWQSLVLIGIVQVIVVYWLLVPRVLDVMQGPVKEAGLLARELDLPTVAYRTSMPSFSVYRDAVTPDRPPQAGDLVFLRIDKLEGLTERFPELGIETRYRRGPVALVYLKPPAEDD